MDVRRRGKGMCTPPAKKYVGGFSQYVFYPCVENVLGLSPPTKISGRAHAVSLPE